MAKSSKSVALVVVTVCVVCGGLLLLFAMMLPPLAHGPSWSPNEKFGDQHLKTTVALIELHRVRTGSYPAELGELKYVGEWDRIALNSVRYCPSPDRTTYYVEVTRGWIGKPTLKMPKAFWQGTGYRADTRGDCP